MDGQEELVRGGQFTAVTPRALRSVAAAGTDHNVLTRRLAGFGPSAITLVAPSVIVSGLEVRGAEEGGEKPPLLPRP